MERAYCGTDRTPHEGELQFGCGGPLADGRVIAVTGGEDPGSDLDALTGTPPLNHSSGTRVL